MKFLHLADLHLGKRVNEISMIPDQRYILGEVLHIIDKEDVAAVLAAGDIYDRTVPSEEAVELFDWFLKELVKREVTAFFISGNHDSDTRLHFGSDLFRAQGLYIGGKYKGQLDHVDMEDEEGKIRFWLLPFVKASQVAHYHPDEACGSYDEAVRLLLGKCRLDPDYRHVLLAHQFVTGGGKDPFLAGSESHRAVSVGTVEKVGADAFEAFDYVALGHIHSPQQVGRETVRYAGSPLKYSLSEAGHEKSLPLVVLGKKGEVDIRLLPLRPIRDLRHVTGSLEELLQADCSEGKEDYIYATLREEIPVLDALERLRQVYPNIMKVDYKRDREKKGEDVFSGKSMGEKSLREIIEEFSLEIAGRELTEQEWEILHEAGREAGLTDETL